YNLPSRRTVIENDVEDVKQYLLRNFSEGGRCCGGFGAAAGIAVLAVAIGAVVMMKRRQ
ncbi:Threonine synthase-like 1, partial [Perkinsus olseni]